MEIFIRRSPEHNKWFRKMPIFILITKVNMWVKVFQDILLSVDKYDSTMCYAVNTKQLQLIITEPLK